MTNPDLPYHTVIVDRTTGKIIAEMHTVSPDNVFALELGAYLPNEVFARKNEIRAYEIVKKEVVEELVAGKRVTTTRVEVSRGGG